MCVRTLSRLIPPAILLLAAVVACQGREDRSAFDLEVGDCIVPPESTPGETVDVERVRTVDCSEPHDAEVIAVFEIERDKGEGSMPSARDPLSHLRYPGDETLFREAQQGCPPKSTFYFYPTEESWTQMGDREVACVVESIYDLHVGDCFNYREREGIIESVQRVSCSKQHSGEVIDVLTMPGTAYPGDDAVDEYAWLNCPEDYDWYLGPTRDSWESAGDRDIQCIRE
jgi:hypothetical protein